METTVVQLCIISEEISILDKYQNIRLPDSFNTNYYSFNTNYSFHILFQKKFECFSHTPEVSNKNHVYSKYFIFSENHISRVTDYFLELISSRKTVIYKRKRLLCKLQTKLLLTSKYWRLILRVKSSIKAVKKV